jgi:hypothetical protein
MIAVTPLLEGCPLPETCRRTCVLAHDNIVDMRRIFIAAEVPYP